LILDSPTVGVDVGSKEEIYQHIQRFAAQGTAVILISDEIPEILANCNKLVVMKKGKVVGRLDSDDLNVVDVRDRINALMDSN